MKRFLLFITLVIVGVLGCGKQPTSINPVNNNTDPAIVYDSVTDSVYANNCTIITNGITYNNTAIVPDTGLALIIRSDSTKFLYSPLQGTLQNMDSTLSRDALLRFLKSRMGGSASKDYSSTAGISVRNLSNYRYEITNNCYRWAAVKSVGSKSTTNVFLSPRDLFNIRISNIFKGRWPDIQFGVCAVDTIQGGYNPETIYMFGSTMLMYRFDAIWYLPLLNSDFATRDQMRWDTDSDITVKLEIAETANMLFLVVEAIYGIEGSEIIEQTLLNDAAFSALYAIGQSGIQSAMTSTSIIQARDEIMDRVFVDMLFSVGSFVVSPEIAVFVKLLPNIIENILGSINTIAYDPFDSWVSTGAAPSIPLLSLPVNGATSVSTTPTMTWLQSTGAITYQAQIATDNIFSNIVLNVTDITNTNCIASGLTSLNLYYWRVRAANGFGTSAWSSAWSFTTTGSVPTVPVLSSPASGSTGLSTSPTLTWNASSGATSYALQVSTSSSFSSYIYNQNGLTSTSQAVSGLSSSTVYYWRVQATNSYGSSAWSLVWNFTTTGSAPSTPILSTPASGSTGISTGPSLAWNSSSGATSYALQVSTSSSFSSYVYNQSGLTSTSQSLSGLNNGIKYYWRVSATNSFGSSAWSTVWNFTTVALGNVTLNPTADAYLYETYPNDNFGTDAGIAVGANGNDDIVSLIKFNISSNSISGVPANSTIKNAVLQLCVFFDRGARPSIYRTTSSWVESSVTWNLTPTWYTTGYSGSLSGSTYEYNVLTIVNKWYTGANTNYGFSLASPFDQGSTVISDITFYSREGTIKPKLVITYEPPAK